MKKILIAFLVLVLAAGVGVYVYVQQMREYITGPEFVVDLEEYLSRVMKVRVDVGKIELHADGDATLIRFAIPLHDEPPSEEGEITEPYPNLVEVEKTEVAFVGLPSLEGHSVMKRMQIHRPHVWFEQLEDGSLSWPSYQAPPNKDGQVPSVEIREANVREGVVVITAKDGFTAVVMEGVSVDGAFEVKEGVITGEGELRADRVVLAGKIILTDFKSPVICRPDGIELKAISGHLYGGTFSGYMSIGRAIKSQPMAINLQIKSIESTEILKDMGLKSALDIGKLFVKFDGGGELLEPLMIDGEGSFRTTKIDASQIPIFARMLNTARQTGVAGVEFESLEGEMTTSRGVVDFSRIESLPRDQSRLSAKGTIDLNGGMNLLGQVDLEGGMVGKVEGFLKDVGILKKDKSLIDISFKVTGDMADPQVEILR